MGDEIEAFESDGEVHGFGRKWGQCLEDHPRTCEWLIIMVGKSPK